MACMWNIESLVGFNLDFNLGSNTTLFKFYVYTHTHTHAHLSLVERVEQVWDHQYEIKKWS